MIEEKVLFVDDDPNILEAYRRQLRKVIRVETALGAAEALKKLEDGGPFAVVISDLRMPGMDGIEFLALIKERCPTTVRMMLTGNADVATAVEAVNEGSIFRFLTKPCPRDVMGKALVAAIEQYRLQTAERDLLEKTLSGCVSLLAEVLSMVCPEAFGRAMKLRSYMHSLADKLQPEDRWEVELAPMLSQIGYVAVPPELAEKALSGRELTPEEEAILNRVPEIGSDLLKKIPRFESLARIILYQQKRFDGSGFPEDSVAGEAIPVGARMLKVLLDLVQAESQGTPRETALGEMWRRGGWYDPKILEAASSLVAPAAPEKEDEEILRLGVALSELRVGDTLLSNVETVDSKLLITGGNTITPLLKERLSNYSKVVGIKEPIHVERTVPKRTLEPTRKE